MPKYRPRVGNSPAKVDDWKPGAAARPTEEFELDYRDDPNVTGYVATWRNPANPQGPRISANLADLLDTNNEATLDANGWVGVMQPNNMTCRLRPGALNPPIPQDYVAVETHQHRRWNGIDADGHPTGQADGQHSHEIPLSDFLLYTYTKNGAERTQFYPRHLH